MKEYSIHCYNKLKLNMSKIILLLSYFFICAISQEIGTEGSIQCGVENMGTDRISGGMETAPNQFPWMVRLPMGCGGSLITDTHILTAKHCVAGGGCHSWGEMVKISVHDQTDPDDYEEVPIKDCVWPDTEDSDIAIIILERPVNLNDNTIGTVCLPASPHEDFRGKKGLALGWGWIPETDGPHIDHGQSAKLRMVDLTVTDRVEDGHPEDFWLFTKVVFNDDGVPLDACAGDSGGPLVYKEGGRWTIIGIVSAGESCADHHGHDAIWAKVTGNLEWIKEVIGM